MLHPSYTELMSKINSGAQNADPVVKSRYSIVMGTAKRARQMVENGYMEQEDHSRKPLSIAVDELDSGLIRILSQEEAAAMQAEKDAREAERLAELNEAAEETAEAAEETAEAAEATAQEEKAEEE